MYVCVYVCEELHKRTPSKLASAPAGGQRRGSGHMRAAELSTRRNPNVILLTWSLSTDGASSLQRTQRLLDFPNKPTTPHSNSQSSLAPHNPSPASALVHPAQPRADPTPRPLPPSARRPPRRMRGPLGACAVRSEAGAAAFRGLRARGGSASLQRGRAADGTRPGRGHPAPSSAVETRKGQSRPRPAAPSPLWPARSSRRRGGRMGKLRCPSRTRSWRWPVSTCCSTTASASPTSSSRSTGEPLGASPQRRLSRSCPGLGAVALPALVCLSGAGAAVVVHLFWIIDVLCAAVVCVIKNTSAGLE